MIDCTRREALIAGLSSVVGISSLSSKKIYEEQKERSSIVVFAEFSRTDSHKKTIRNPDKNKKAYANTHAHKKLFKNLHDNKFNVAAEIQKNSYSKLNEFNWWSWYDVEMNLSHYTEGNFYEGAFFPEDVVEYAIAIQKEFPQNYNDIVLHGQCHEMKNFFHIADDVFYFNPKTLNITVGKCTSGINWHDVFSDKTFTFMC